MSFVGKAIRSVVGAVGGALGLTPQQPQVQYIPMAAPAATQADTSAQMDQAAQLAAAGVQRGRTSTLLTGGTGDTTDQKNTSKILLGQ